ncbi:hypothetical protein RP20_CCG027304 [Aedes albopictus]|nr:hypothetical protein RP20_CCG027304 [Aedes albopictus]
MHNPLEPGLNKLTAKVETRCPIKAGHKEKFDMVEVGSFGLTLPPSFAGDWKVYVEMWITRDGQVEHECCLTPATIYEA